MAQYQDSNEYFRSSVYGVTVLILEKISWHPGEEAVVYLHHPRGVDEHTFPYYPPAAVVIWFVYLHDKKSPGGFFFPGMILIRILVQGNNEQADGE